MGPKRIAIRQVQKVRDVQLKRSAPSLPAFKDIWSPTVELSSPVISHMARTIDGDRD